MPKFRIYTLGCKVNQYDSGFIAEGLKSLGFESATNGADLVIINTCAVTHRAISKDKRMINKARRENKDARIIVFGCWPKVYPRIKIDNVEAVLGTGEFEKLFKKVKNIFKIKKRAQEHKIISTQRTRYFLKIQDGCEQFCSYCVIPFARGPLKSRPAQDVIKEAKNAIKHGYKEIVLTGIHLGLYGRKGRGRFKYDLAQLIQRLLSLPHLGRLRLSSIEITEVDDKIISLMQKDKKFCSHLHIPLQAGSDKILKLMNRPYTKKYFLNKIKKIKKKVPNIAITTDIIVGFPGETDKNFMETYNFSCEVGFSRIHVFSFSAHSRTPASRMPNQVDKKTIEVRSKKLHKLSEKIEKEFKNKFCGRELEVLVEQQKDDYFMGRTEYYFIVSFKKNDIIKKYKNMILQKNVIYKIKTNFLY